MTPDAWLTAGRTFSFEGLSVFYRDEGGAPSESGALLLIHGYPTSSYDYAAIWPRLVTRFSRAMAPDMLGFGFSAKPHDHDYSIFEQAALHEALLEHLRVKRVHLLAHDYGVTVAQELLARQLDRQRNRDRAGPEILSCALLNGGLFPETHRARTIQKLLNSPLGPLLSKFMSRKSFGKSFSEVFGPKTKPTEAELDTFWALASRDGGARAMQRLIRYIPERRANRERWVGALQKTQVPLCLINGPEDPVSGAHMVARYREVVNKGEIVSLPGIGHYPQVEDPEGVLKAFLSFQRGLSASC